MAMSVVLSTVTLDGGRIAENSISISNANNNTRSLSISLYAVSTTIPNVGEDIRVYEDSTLLFGGNIKDITLVPITPKTGSSADVRCDIYSDGYNGIANRRTVDVDASDTTAGAIVSDIIANYLAYEGVSEGDVDAGATITAYGGYTKSTKEILDDMADASGYEWTIDNNKYLNFKAPSTITTSTQTVTETDGTHFNFRLTQSLGTYRNKQFVVGGLDSTGAIVSVSVEDAAEIANRAALELIETGTGVYGNVFKDTNIQNTTDATAVATELLNRYKNTYVATFNTYVQYTLGSQIKVTYPKYKIATNTNFLITNVVAVRDVHRWLYTYTIEQRDYTAFSSRPKESAVDFFSKLARPDKALESSANNIFVQPSEPTGAPTDSLWVDTDNYSRYDVLVISSDTTLTVSGAEQILASGATTITLFTAVGNTGVYRRIVNTGSGTITIDGNVSETVKGSATKTLTTTGAEIILVSDGTNWW